MNFTPEQVEQLRKYLRKELKYRETSEEVYDHILTALQEQFSAISFEQAVNDLIKADFGGGEGLLEMEKQCYKSVINDVTGQQWSFFKSHFKLNTLPVTLVLFLATYYSLITIRFSPFILMLLLFTVMVVPGLFVMTRYFSIGYFIKDTRKSIRDSIYGKIAGRPLLILNPGFWSMWVFNKKINVNSWIPTHAFLVSIGVVILLLYIFSFIKLSKNEFKIYMIR